MLVCGYNSISLSVSSPGLTGRSSIPETVVLEPMGRSVLDRPPSRAMTDVDVDAASRSRDMNRPSFAYCLALSFEEGAGKAGCRSHPWIPCNKKHGSRTTGVTGNNPAFPARWVTAYTCSPRRDWALLSPPSQRRLRALREGTPATRASGLHDFAVHLLRPRQLRNRRPPHPTPRS
jgi:hypothetical protein